MTPAEFRAARHALGLTQDRLGWILGYGHGAQSRISDIERGRAPVTPCVERLLRAYLAGYRPSDWPAPRRRDAP